MADHPATIRDVARAAQLSVASISRVLNGQNNVHPDTRQRVLAAMKALDYVPNAAARSLSRARTHAVGVVLPDLHGEFFSEMMRGMDAVASARGYLLLLANMHADPLLAGQALATMHGRVDGLVVMAPQLAASDLSATLPATLPTVLVNSPRSEDHYGLGVDNRAGIGMLVEHLLAQGCRHIVHLAGDDANLDARERRQGFEAAMAAHAPDLPVRIVSGDFQEASGTARIAELIAAGEPFDAVLAANDMMAVGAMMALRESGREGRIAIAGFDDIPLARFVGLTSMRVDVAGIGARAIGRLLDHLEAVPGEPGQERIVPELIVRASTGRGTNGWSDGR